MLGLLRISLGILLLVLGLIGGLIPIVQGWIFGCLGAILLSREFPFLRKWIYKIRTRVPASRKWIRSWMLWVKRNG